MVEKITLIVNLLLSSGIVSMLLFYGSKRRKSAAEADKSEGDVIRSFAHEWKEIADEREQKIVLKDSKIDELYKEITLWRDQNNELASQLAETREQKQVAVFRECHKRGCQLREPQSGF